ncbi:hypothetical protein EYF80_011823 [Liparis tanakae]|uniref:Uncharacterized protein n=1 Tax=Liparis tanakae TaxID=230148 RepID=A0A4Z2IIQ8_9TELE|nr:hypothetical protein EYF80_011823 [Liparis tanakae]
MESENEEEEEDCPSTSPLPLSLGLWGAKTDLREENEAALRQQEGSDQASEPFLSLVDGAEARMLVSSPWNILQIRLIHLFLPLHTRCDPAMTNRFLRLTRCSSLVRVPAGFRREGGKTECGGGMDGEAAVA